ncbi:MAG: hypothetical protein MZV63_36210 [Marinilabiliales bacterium]|nr:hypothetical protein [Marinilabiliales bacterium]
MTIEAISPSNKRPANEPSRPVNGRPANGPRGRRPRPARGGRVRRIAWDKFQPRFSIDRFNSDTPIPVWRDSSRKPRRTRPSIRNSQ